MNPPRIIFVGIHNKPGLAPLDSSTRSGKLIDRIIAEMPGVQVVKSNLYDLDYLPDPPTGADVVRDWAARVYYDPNTDVAVSLGDNVHFAFLIAKKFHYVRLAHPSSIWAKGRRDKYVLSALELIRQYLTTHMLNMIHNAKNRVLHARR